MIEETGFIFPKMVILEEHRPFAPRNSIVKSTGVSSLTSGAIKEIVTCPEILVIADDSFKLSILEDQ